MEDKTFELIEKMYNEFSKRFESMDERFESMDKRFDRLEEEVRKTNVTIEHDIISKIDALFDGHKQHTAQLERIEIAVSRHEDFIMKRIK